MTITLDNFNLVAAERRLIVEALLTSGSIFEASKLLGVTRHAVKRRIIKHRIPWVRAGHTGKMLPDEG